MFGESEKYNKERVIKMSFPFVDKTSSYQQAVGFMNTSGEIYSTYKVDLPVNGLAITSVTALGLESVSFVQATLNNTGVPTSTGCSVLAAVTAGTSITFAIHDCTGVAVTAAKATGLILTVLAFGTPSYS